MGDLHVVRWGKGERAVLVHGSFGWGEETWAEQRPLAERYRLVLVDRRGFGGSPPDGRVDFERDAGDVADVLRDGAHLVGHSYGGVVALLAAARKPDAVRSLAVIEPPALGLVRGDAVVKEFVGRVARAIEEADDASDYRVRFLRAFGFEPPPGTLKEPHLSAAEASWRERPPWEAEIPLGDLRAASFPKLVVRGAWDQAPPEAQRVGRAALHAVCDVLERRLDAATATFAGAAHNPQLLGAPFNDRLLELWRTS